MTKQFLKFILAGIAGIAGIVVNFVIYNLVLQAFSLLGWSWEYTYLVAQLIGYHLSVLVTFLLCRRFVFNAPSERAVPWLRALLKMYLVYSFSGIVINSLLSLLWVRILGVPRELVSILNDVCSGPVNFLLNKFWSFRYKKVLR